MLRLKLEHVQKGGGVKAPPGLGNGNKKQSTTFSLSLSLLCLLYMSSFFFLFFSRAILPSFLFLSSAFFFLSFLGKYLSRSKALRFTPEIFPIWNRFTVIPTPPHAHIIRRFNISGPARSFTIQYNTVRTRTDR
ncbi:hypothetical protein K504DRAFT_144348 [Pleomassaria siparia CBS 279.74]|uniref:Transmembrane protein n=1 Tax=Pleomassaria siparia CBS 279.74 TaxID=1314801 RepID=A0A6G1KM36_9PLEO|nr:hypothetical protein K504DRAFT_144348 [Pleomassaria siparia CBS 279.74]